MQRLFALLATAVVISFSANSCEKPLPNNKFTQQMLDSSFLVITKFHEKMQAHNAALRHKRDSLHALPGLARLNADMRASFIQDLDTIYADSRHRVDRHAALVQNFKGLILANVYINNPLDSSLAANYRQFMESQAKFEKGLVRDEQKFADMQRQLTDVLNGKRR